MKNWNREKMDKLLDKVKETGKRGNEKILKELLEDLKASKITNKDNCLYTTIHIFGEANYLEARKEVEKFLRHRNPELRHIALSVLGLHWQLRDYTKTFIKFLKNDPDRLNRYMAISCLGLVNYGTKNKKILKLLFKILKNRRLYHDTVESAYNAIGDVIGIPYTLRGSLDRLLNSKKNIDLKLIESLEKGLGLKDENKTSKVKK